MQQDEIFFCKFKKAYQKVLNEISQGTGVLTMIPDNAPPEGNKAKEKRGPKAADDIIEAIILVIAERESSNYQIMTHVIGQSYRLKLAFKTLEACVCTLTAANSKDKDGMIIR